MFTVRRIAVSQAVKLNVIFYNKTLFNLFTLVRAELTKVWLTIIRFYSFENRPAKLRARLALVNARFGYSLELRRRSVIQGCNAARGLGKGAQQLL